MFGWPTPLAKANGKKSGGIEALMGETTETMAASHRKQANPKTEP